jgi:hypothetical protein
MNSQSIVLSNSDLRNRGFTYAFTVVEVDDEPPQLISIVADPPSVNTILVSCFSLSIILITEVKLEPL